MLHERPKFHRGETEVRGMPDAADMALLRADERDKLGSGAPFAMGIDEEIARFIYSSVGVESVTLETGAGLSTLIFALRGARHFAVTPSGAECEAIRDYAAASGIDLSRVSFVKEPSEAALPVLDTPPLDFVLIDGKHAFPWPILDWFYTAERLKKGGIVVLDDTPLWGVGILADFLAADQRNWASVTRSRKAHAFRKLVDSAHNVAWYMQPHADTLRLRLLRSVPPSLLQAAKRLRG
jgi:predicted O-methyltransferase YrrM